MVRHRQRRVGLDDDDEEEESSNFIKYIIITVRIVLILPIAQVSYLRVPVFRTKVSAAYNILHQFRVRSNSNANSFSPPSEAMVAKGLSQALRKRWFNTLEGNGTLLQSGSTLRPVPLADALGGKEFVLFYVSAHWCPPCRKFTPMLANWYKTPAVRPCVEVVFLSADHDRDGFESYFRASHPWMAIAYEDDTRENLQSVLQVQGIPRLVVIDASTGNIVENNAVGKPLDLNQWRRSARQT